MPVVLAGGPVKRGLCRGLSHSLEQMLIEDLVQDVPTTPFVSCTGYLFDFAGRSRTRLTTDCESRNIRAIAAGFMPVE
jgi:hypothetical protein